MSDDSDEPALYIKVQCSLCLGGVRKGIFMNCPYCDADRQTYIEASFNNVKKILASTLEQSAKNELITYLKKDD